MEYRRKLTKDEVLLLSKDLVMVMGLFEKAGKEIYLVGAGVRNILMGKTPVNCDLTTNATPEETLGICSGFDPFYENDFGMVGVPIGDEVFEITTYRTEKGYSDFRRPDEVIWGKSLADDVVRRDFTMNAVVIGKTKGEYEVIDLVGGIADFDNNLIRSVGIATERFTEDPLRMMRAVRFAATLQFTIESETFGAIISKAPLLEKISRERIRDEFLKTLASKFPADGVRVFLNTGLMSTILPELETLRAVGQNGHHTLDVLEHSLGALENCPSSNPIVRLATLIHDIGKPKAKRNRCRGCRKFLKYPKVEDGSVVCEYCHLSQPERETITFYGHEVVGEKMAIEICNNLRLTNKEREKIAKLVRWHMFSYQKEMTDASIRRLIKNVGKENINDLMLLRIGDRVGGGSKTTSWRLMELQKRIGEQLFEPMEIRDMEVNGKDVMEILGVTPGPIIGKILGLLFEEVIEDTARNKRDYLLGRIKELANDTSRNNQTNPNRDEQ